MSNFAPSKNTLKTIKIMKAIKFFAVMVAMLAMSVNFSSCKDDDDPVIQEVEKNTTCTVVNQVSGMTLRDVNAIHVNSKGEEIKMQFLGDIPSGSSKTFNCIGTSVYFRLDLNGKIRFTADTDLKSGENTEVVIDGNTYLYQ